ncbi:General secretion proteinH [Mesorhizobium metallidurans STM 2683]|uniref:General secretion proteinH n=1 Tax=Mesorhizobium metallidurans STM 2683 TaxID=1297569 RepID=M5FC70_9HYPH|nr:prepilin-type N-terminal cleavage/methylation domain-containing protein [Mesorhizobium metallidurans]CCV09526.1 General secretion proteinH [Mesorhizobium metallidurans STM 2683]
MRAASQADGCADKTAGFTLVEMLVVLAIMAVVAAIAAPGIARNYRAKNLDTLTSEITTQFRLSRTSAIATAKPKQIVLDPRAGAIRFDVRNTLILPEDVKMTVITGQETVAADRQAILTFLPDGSASGVEINLKRKDQTSRIEVNWLTGLSTRRKLP